jgi:thermitase
LGTPQYSRAFEETIEKAEREGILIVTSAGNDGKNLDKTPYYPASFTTKNLISVAAIDNQGKPPEWTNYGARSIHIAAPGVWIYSTVNNGKYIYAAGTSMAAPHVAGAAVLMMTAHPEWNYAEIKSRILSSCEPNGKVQNLVACGGNLNVARALGL